MKKLNYLVFALLMGLISLDTSAQRVIGYYAGWSQAYTGIQYTKLTDINYAFAEPQTNNTVAFSDNYQRQLFEQFLPYAKQRNVKINISIGGASDVLAARFHQIGNTTASARAFAASCVTFCINYGIDGIDIDWEPVETSSATQFTRLMQELRNEINTRAPYLQLSAAVFPDQWQNGGVTSNSFQYVDYFNLMTYDYGGSGFPHHSPAGIEVQSINYWANTKGLAKSKMVLGLPFYGRPQNWQYVQSQQIAYNTLANQAGQSLIAGKDQHNNWRYNGQATIKSKTSYALNQGLKGVMIWEISQDLNNQFSLLNKIQEAISEIGCQAPSLGSNQSICAKANISLTSGLDQSTYSFVWRRNNQVIGGATSPNYTATQGGLYEVAATRTGTNCTRTAEVRIDQEFPNFDLGNDVPLCGIETVNIDANLGITGANYSWTGPNSQSGNTSTIAVNQEGQYTITVTDPQGKCPSKQASVNGTSTGLDVQAPTRCGPGEVELRVLSAGGPYSWFDAQTGGNLVGLGNPITTEVTQTKTFYVQNTGGSLNTSFGWNYNRTGCAPGQGPGCDKGDYADQLRLVFDVFQEMKLDSVTIHYGGAWNSTAQVTFTVRNSSGNVVGTAIANVDGNARQRLPVGIELTPGTNYTLGMTSAEAGLPGPNGHWTEKRPFGDNFDYPFTVDGIVSIKHTVAQSESNFQFQILNWYAGFYDIAISTGTPCPRVPVTATVQTCTPANVVINSPLDGAVVVEGSNVDLSATVTHTKALSDVGFFINGTRILNIDTDGNTRTASYTPGSQGTYEFCVRALDVDGQLAEECVTFSATEDIGTGYDNASTGNGLNIFPNPFENTLNIALDQSAHGATVTVFNANGQVVYNGTYKEQILLGDALESGFYTVQVVTANKVAQTKVFKK